MEKALVVIGGLTVAVIVILSILVIVDYFLRYLEENKEQNYKKKIINLISTINRNTEIDRKPFIYFDDSCFYMKKIVDVNGKKYIEEDSFKYNKINYCSLLTLVYYQNFRSSNFSYEGH